MMKASHYLDWPRTKKIKRLVLKFKVLVDYKLECICISKLKVECQYALALPQPWEIQVFF